MSPQKLLAEQFRQHATEARQLRDKITFLWEQDHSTLNIGVQPAARRFPPPWDIEEHECSCFIVRDNNGQALAYVYFETEPGRRTAANLLTRDEEIARNIANYFVFISRARVGVSGAVKMFLALRG